MGFQEQVSGVPRLSDGRMVEYCVTSPETGRPVSYDGHTYRDRPEGGTQEVFLESKRGYRFLAFSPDTTKSQRVKEKILDEADRQTGALPEGARLEWHISDPYGAGAIRQILDEGGYFDIELFNTPEAGQ
jgi:hypothetical protein